ncbi:galactonate dehydratase [Paraoerskovia sediminicola]|uniref:Galactonate dehydratase n=1 Tax=Paraoerskovia sediminicola TaxID=1138587 RepID=A0ABM8G1N6_9CELL|nr:galactonate dehydratase [Paraoerskovia sediminicola]BDZ41949.1 galactonate dehydratase [Paraoerskovia sediminicola]
MKIARVETFLIPPRWLFVRIETDDGLVGWGEPVVEGRAATVRAAVDELTPELIGRDPSRIEDIWQTLTRSTFYRGGPVLSSAVAGVDQALWDIAGKRLGVPVHDLLGGAVRDRARVYAWIAGDRPGDIAEEAAVRLDEGFTCVKMNGSAELRTIDTPAALARVVDGATAVRGAIGDEADFAIDFHGRFSPAMARRALPQLEPLLPLFVEEPTVPELALEHLPRITASTSIPIATGERAYSRWDFRPLMDTGIAVAQPDVSHAGGISEMRRIAALAETHGVSLAPHCPLGPIALAACLQVDFATPNFLIQEQSRGIHYNKGWDLLNYVVDTSVFDISDGHMARPTAPGLGIEVDEQAVREAAERGHDWHAPVWHHADGSLSEW